MGEDLDRVWYAYGNKVALSFEVVKAETDQNMLATIDVNAMDVWRLGLHMYM
jgi:hypothetical protein